MNKSQLIHRIGKHLGDQLETMRKAAQSARDAATGDEAKSEGKYDTRGLEASYLAHAQADQCQKLEHAVQLLSSFAPTPQEDGTVAAGSLVETESGGVITHYLLLPCAGGITIEENGMEITTLAPDAPVYDALIGCKTGDLIDGHDLIVLDVL